MTNAMTVSQMEHMATLMHTLAEVRLRIERSQGMFPNYQKELQQRYDQMIAQARANKMLPDWLK